MSHTFVIMAGGTGGHVFPGIALGNRLRDAGYEVQWLGTRAGIESRLVPEQGFTLHCIPVSGVRGKGLRALLLAPWMIFRSLWAAARILRQVKPAVVIGMGGFASGPGALVARLMGKPLVLHEQNSVLGTTNKLLQHIASVRLEGFPQTFSRRRNTFYVGNPVRKEIAELSQHRAAAEPAEPDSCRVLIVGGSRGARALNQLVPTILQHVTRKHSIELEIIHQSGDAEMQETQERYQANNLTAEVVAFIGDMAKAYQWADLVICRAGAMTVAELACAGVASVLVPFPYAIDDHQTENARWLERGGAGLLVPQTQLEEAETQERIATLLCGENKRSAMARAAAELAIHDSDQQVANHCRQQLEAS